MIDVDTAAAAAAAAAKNTTFCGNHGVRTPW